MPAVSFSEAAAALGHRSRSSLYRMRDDGRLADYIRPGGRGGAALLELEPEGLPTLREWVRDTLQPQTPAVTTPTAELAAVDPQTVARGLAELVAGLPEDAIPSLSCSRERREHYRAELARLEALQRRGDLVPAAEVKHEAYEVARAVRDRLLSLPHRLAPQLAVTRDTTEAFRLLDSEIRTSLYGLVEQDGRGHE
jgi:hypothetical protein